MYLCSLTGSVFIVGGLYMLLWGKSREAQMEQSKTVSSKGTVQCEAIHITNPSSACSQNEHARRF